MVVFVSTLLHFLLLGLAGVPKVEHVTQVASRSTKHVAGTVLVPGYLVCLQVPGTYLVSYINESIPLAEANVIFIDWLLPIVP